MRAPIILVLVAFCALVTESTAVNPGNVVGGIKHVEDLEEIREIIDHALKTFNKQSNSTYQHRLVSVYDATKQLVAGVKYKFTMELAPITGNAVDGEDATSGHGLKRIAVTVLHQPWKRVKHPQDEFQVSFTPVSE